MVVFMIHMGTLSAHFHYLFDDQSKRPSLLEMFGVSREAVHRFRQLWRLPCTYALSIWAIEIMARRAPRLYDGNVTWKLVFVFFAVTLLLFVLLQLAAVCCACDICILLPWKSVDPPPTRPHRPRPPSRARAYALVSLRSAA